MHILILKEPCLISTSPFPSPMLQAVSPWRATFSLIYLWKHAQPFLIFTHLVLIILSKKLSCYLGGWGADCLFLAGSQSSCLSVSVRELWIVFLIPHLCRDMGRSGHLSEPKFRRDTLQVT